MFRFLKSKKSQKTQDACKCGVVEEKSCGCEAQKCIDMAIVEANKNLKEKQEARARLEKTDECLIRLELLWPGEK